MSDETILVVLPSGLSPLLATMLLTNRAFASASIYSLSTDASNAVNAALSTGLFMDSLVARNEATGVDLWRVD